MRPGINILPGDRSRTGEPAAGADHTGTEPVTNRVTKCTSATRPNLPAGVKDTPGARAAFDSLVTAGITGATEVTGERATVIGQQTVGLSSDFVRELLAAKDRQIETLLALVGQLKDEAAK